jgi:Urease alpha-subunit, N-terminal domain
MRTKHLIIAIFFAFFLQGLNSAISATADRSSASGLYDVVIANGKIIDGSGNPWFYADVEIKNGKIAKVGKVDSRMGKRVIDAKGMVVSPGFIDLLYPYRHAGFGGRQCRKRGASRRDP